MKTVLVVGREWNFRALLRAQLREEGYQALAFERLEEAAGQIAGAAPPPAALVFDTAQADAAAMQAQLAAVAGRLPVVVVAAAHESFDSGSLRVLRRPVRLEDVVAAVKALA